MTPIERAAAAIWEECQKQNPLPFEYGDADNGASILDGAYDLKAVASAVLTAIQDSISDAAVDAAKPEVLLDEDDGFREGEKRAAVVGVWQAIIDAMLKEGSQ